MSKMGCFSNFFGPLTPQQIFGREVTCRLLIHAICAIFEVNRLRNTSVIGEKPSKTSKIGCFSNFYGPLTPPKSYRPRSYMQFVNTRICAIFEVNQLRNTSAIGEKPSKTSKIGCFSNFYGPPDPKSKIGLCHYTRLCNTQLLR